MATITIAGKEITIEFDEKMIKYTLQTIPDVFLQWQSDARMRMFEVMHTPNIEAMKTPPAHLPVMATLGNDPVYPNLSFRGIGVLPKPGILAKFTSILENAKAAAGSTPSQESFSIRGQAIASFYSDSNNFDPLLLGGLEMIEGITASNLKNRPFASLLYSGEAPKYPGYQINGVIEVVEPDTPDHPSPYFKFLLAAREIFMTDAFHIEKIYFPFGYLFHPVAIKNKKPHPKK